MKWSNYQKAIFEDVANGQGSTIVEALAGSSKTTSLVQSLNYLPKDASWLLVAFNKRIAEELKTRAPAGGEIQTLHALGLKAVSRTFPGITVEPDKVNILLSKVLSKADQELDNRTLPYKIAKGVSLAKAFLATTVEEIDDVLDEFGDILPVEMEREPFINHILFTLDLCKRKNLVLDFDDMIWFPNVLKINIPKYDNIFVDEGQDLNKAQIEFVLKMSGQKSRTFVFMDKHQAIYLWRGADANSMARFQEALKAKTLPLSITYRCPKAVVTEAQVYVPALEAAPNAMDGKVERINYAQMYKMAKPGCFIISRKNAPLMKAALNFLKNKIPCNIQGRDIGDNLSSLIKKSRAKTLDKLIAYIERWKEKEIARLIKKGKDENSLAIDKADCLISLAGGCASISELKSTINTLFSDTDDRNRIILSSTHKAKGLERDVVFLLWGTYSEHTQEEINLKYVAITRAKKELYFVEYGKDKESKSADKIIKPKKSKKEEYPTFDMGSLDDISHIEQDLGIYDEQLYY